MPALIRLDRLLCYDRRYGRDASQEADHRRCYSPVLRGLAMSCGVSCNNVTWIFAFKKDTFYRVALTFSARGVV